MQRVCLWAITILCAFAIGSQSWAQVSVWTQHNDNSRTGQNVNETNLTPAIVSTQFGRLFSQSVDGQIYAQPLYLPNVNIPGQGTHNVVYVATEHDSVYAFDADTPSSLPLWQVSFINPAAGINTVSTSDVGSSDISPEYGITGTPVIDTQSGTLYAVANTNESGNIVYRLHALDVTSGAEKFAGPVLIQASVLGIGDGSVGGMISFNAVRHLQRPGLLLMNGIVYIGFGSHSDIDPYHGWLLAYDAHTLQQVGVYNATANGSRGAIWQAGAGLAGDTLGNVYFSTGNGTFDATSSNPADFGDSILKIGLGGGNFSVADYFTPYNQAALATADADLGSGGVLLLPDQPGLFPHLLVQAGEPGTIYLLNRDSLGHYNSAGNGDPQIVQELQNALGSGNNNAEFGMPAYWNNNVYFWSSSDVLKAYSLTNGLLSPSPTSNGTISAGVQCGPTPSISANGTSNGIVWALQTDAVSTNGPAVLYAFDATNVANVLYSSATNAARDNPGAAVKFTVPTVANGKVYVGTQNQLSVFALTYSISGTITPSAGGAGATVTLSGAASATTSADASGNYTFSGLANGVYTVTPSESGFGFSPAGQTVAVNGANLLGVNFAASPLSTWSISGTITNGSLATVTLGGAASASVTADASGNYSFSGLVNGAYTVTPSKPGFSFTPSSQPITVNGANVTGVNFSAQTGWSVVYVDSQETVGENGAGVNAIDGNPASKWVTQWSPTSTPLPHEIQINLGASYNLTAFQYLARQDGCAKGWIKDYEFYVSTDGVHWGTPVASGTFNYGNLSTGCPGTAGVPGVMEIAFAATTGQYIRLRAFSEIHGNPWTVVAELNVLGTADANAPPPSLAQVTVNPSIVVGGTSAQGRVSLSGPAPLGGAVVNLSSSDPSATVPASVTVPANSTSANFTISTSAVGTPTPLNISGSYNGSAQAAFTVNPGTVISPTGWSVVYVDSQETARENGAGVNAIDGNPASKWVTQWSPSSAPLPHEIQINLGASYNLTAFQYLARQDGCANGWIKQYEFYVSTDGVHWGTPVASGNFDYSNLSTSCPGTAGVPGVMEIAFAATTGQYIRLRAFSEIHGNPWTVVAELNVLGTADANAPPPSLAQVTVNPSIVVGGTSAQGRVRLSGPAPLGGAVVNLSSSDPSATVPASVTVPANSTSANFTISTSAVGTPTPLNISGSYNGSAQAAFTVNPGTVISPTGWSVVYVDSQETARENGAGVNAIDGNPASKWVTQWSPSSAPLPHEIQIHLGASYNLTAFQYLARQDGCANGWIKDYEFYVSTDGVNWGTPVASGTFNYGNLSTGCPGTAGVPGPLQVAFPATTGQYIRLRALSEINGKPYTAVAEIGMLSVPDILPAAPVLVQHVSGSSTRNNGFSDPFCYDYQLPGLTTAGNSVVVGFTFMNNPTPAVTDDKGDIYTIEETHFDNADGQSVGIAAAFHVAAGARVISLCFSSDPGGFVQPMATEFANVTGVDGPGTGNHGTGASVTAGNLTPTVSGDLVYQVVASLSRNQSSFTAGAQGNLTWNLLSADLMDGWAGQYGVYNSTSALNPTMTMGTSQKWVSAAILLKSGNSGSVPSGMRIVHLVHENIPKHTSSGGTGNPFPNPLSLQLPCSGNLLVAMIGGGNNSETVTRITDTSNNTWSQAGSTQVIAGNDTVQAFYAGSATPSSNLGLTLNWTGGDGDFTIFFYDVTGAAASPLDTTAGSTGTQSIAGNLTMPFTITPATPHEIIFAEVIWDFNTATGLNGQLFDTNTFSGEDLSGPEPVDENNGWGHVITTTTGPVGFTWQPLSGSLPVGPWAGMAAAFKAAN